MGENKEMEQTMDSSELTPKQELFCTLYARDREFFGNGTQAYIEAYNIDISKKGAYKAAQASSSRLLSNAIILRKIREMMETATLNDEFVDRELAFLIEQDAEKSVKLGAIREYNALKTRIQNKLDLTLKTPMSNIKFVFKEDGDEGDNNKPETETGTPNSN